MRNAFLSKEKFISAFILKRTRWRGLTPPNMLSTNPNIQYSKSEIQLPIIPGGCGRGVPLRCIPFDLAEAIVVRVSADRTRRWLSFGLSANSDVKARIRSIGLANARLYNANVPRVFSRSETLNFPFSPSHANPSLSYSPPRVESVQRGSVNSRLQKSMFSAPTIFNTKYSYL